MGKKLLIFSLLFFCMDLMAQNQTEDDDSSCLDKISVGIKGGANFPSMVYSSAKMKSYDSDVYTKGLFGIYSEIGLGKKANFSVRPEFVFLYGGQRIKSQGVDYSLDIKYMDIRLPFVYTYKAWSVVQPYVFVAPSVGFAYGGDIRLDNEWKTSVSDANVKPVNFSVLAGVGAKFPVHIRNVHYFTVGAEVSYNLGLTDTYSGDELDNKAFGLNQDPYNVTGKRRARSIEAAVTLSVPLKLFKKKRKPVVVPTVAPIVVVEQPKPVQKEEVIVPVVVKVEKECYSLEEMQELISQGRDVNGLKICAINQINFEFARSTFDKNSQAYLDKIILLMENSPAMKFKINGHTDNVGSESANLKLSQMRAEAVYRYIVSKGISASRLSYDFYGMSKPIATNDTAEGRSINRRVEFELIK